MASFNEGSSYGTGNYAPVDEPVEHSEIGDECWGLTFSQVETVIHLVLHFTHIILCVIISVVWDYDEPSDGQKIAYTILSTMAAIVFLVFVSPFHMWSIRGYPDVVVSSRRAVGLVINLLFCDLPMFCIETDVVVKHGFIDTLWIMSYMVTVVSFLNSFFRVWLFIVGRCMGSRLRRQRPNFANQNMGGHHRYNQQDYQPSSGIEPYHGPLRTANTRQSDYNARDEYFPPFPVTRYDTQEPGFMHADNSDLYKPPTIEDLGIGIIPKGIARRGVAS